MKQQTKFSHEQQQTRVEEHQTHLRPAHRDFASAEELLRYDAAHTEVPPEIAARLQKSAANLPPPAPWWKRFFRGSSQ
jgi:hypothetical protein